MSPITLPAAIAQQHAEVLAGIVLAQCVNPGCPVIYGGFITPLDMQSGAVPFGTPEATWTLAAGAQMARHVGLPYRSSGALTTSQLPDAQAAYESLFNLWPAVMARTNVILQAAGWLDGGLVASFEKFMLDIELIERLFAVYRAPRVDTTALALDQIDAIGPGGHHLDSDYTRKRYRNAFFRSTLSSLAPHETWRDEGGLDAAQRANRAWKDKLSAYKPPPIDQGVVEALDAYKSRRIEQIMGAEGDTLSSR
jgi:trimethylamine--corrinoid protein Co-methyltransferase